MLVSICICQTNMDLHSGDPGRIAAQVLTGIGFIGAGLISSQFVPWKKKEKNT